MQKTAPKNQKTKLAGHQNGQSLTPNPPVWLVGSGSGPATGISRYARSLGQALKTEGQAVNLVGSPPTPVPAWLVRGAKRAGFDLKSFFNTYPMVLSAKDRPGHNNGLLHLTSQGHASLLAFPPGRRTLPRTVVTVHDLITLVGRHDPELAGYMRFYDRLFDNLSVGGLRRAAALIADSEHTRQDILRRLDYPADRVKVVYIGVDQTIFRPVLPTADFYARYGLQRDLLYMMYAGSDDPRKNLRRLLEAFARLLNEFPNVRLVKVGAARFEAERSNLITLAQSLGLADRLIFVNQVSEEDLVQFYNLASVFVYPALYEGFGLPPLEAMACGTPVVVSDRTALPEVVGEAGLMVNPYKVEEIVAGLRQVLSDPLLAARLRQAGLERAAGFSWERTARQTQAVYNEVLAENSGENNLAASKK